MKNLLLCMTIVLSIHHMAFSQQNDIKVYYVTGQVTTIDKSEISQGDIVSGGIIIENDSKIILFSNGKIIALNETGKYSTSDIEKHFADSDQNFSKEYFAFIKDQILHGHHGEEHGQNVGGAVSRSGTVEQYFPIPETKLINDGVFFVWKNTGAEYYYVNIYDDQGGKVTSYSTIDTTFYMLTSTIGLSPGNYSWSVSELETPAVDNKAFTFEVLANEEAEQFREDISYYGDYGQQDADKRLKMLYYQMNDLYMELYLMLSIENEDLSDSQVIDQILNL